MRQKLHIAAACAALAATCLLIGASNGAAGAALAWTWERLGAWQDGAVHAGPITVFYPPRDRSVAEVILRLAVHAMSEEARNLGVSSPPPLSIFLYNQLTALDASAGLPSRDDVVGLYAAGTVRVLNPQTWIPGPGWRAAFRFEGPVPHEIGHALLNDIAHGNYPAWFNEGVAQYEDERVTGFVWLTPANRWSQPLYSMAQLTRNFYGLSNQALAYREALGLVGWLVQARGAAHFNRFLRALGGAHPFSWVLREWYGLTPGGLYRRWVRTVRPEQPPPLTGAPRPGAA
jgi:hypothetical protein